MHAMDDNAPITAEQRAELRRKFAKLVWGKSMPHAEPQTAPDGQLLIPGEPLPLMLPEAEKVEV